MVSAYSGQMNGGTLTITQCAARIGISRRQLHNWIKEGRFPVAAIPGTKPRRWSVEAVEAWRLAPPGDA